MKKILYGVQGTGNGHTTRARMMAKAFQQVDVEVDYFFSGRPHDKYFDMDVFRGYRIEEGVTLSYDRGKVSPFKTYIQADLTRLFRDIRSLDLSCYDLILNDFEPITAWAGRFQKKPVIAMSHQASFMHQAVPKSGGHFMTRQMIKWFAPADLYLGVHWYHFGGAIIPPFIEPYDATSPDQNSILVYLPFESLDDIVELLRCFEECRFICYHPDAVDQEVDHIQLRAPSRDAFLEALSEAAGVIANAGFELSSEALTLGKKLLLKPLHGQFEQLSNALTLEQMNVARVMHQFDEHILEEWLEMGSFEPIRFPHDPGLLVDWIIQGNWHAQVDELCEALWAQVNFPVGIKKRMMMMI